MKHRPEVQIEDRDFAIVTSGFADGPAQALREYLVGRGARRIVYVAHPLVPEGPNTHVMRRIERGDLVSERVIRLPNRPPLTFALDPFIPPVLPRVDAWFGFNCLATAHGIAHRAVRRARRVIHWSVDYVPERFGPGRLTSVYETMDRYCCVHADGRIDLSSAALEARSKAYDLDARAAPSAVVPMGAWITRTPKATESNFQARRIVFLGHLVPRMGVDVCIDALAELRSRRVPFVADIIGDGPLLCDMRTRAAARGIGDVVTFHGFVHAFADVERLLARATIAVAPYVEDDTSFTRFADPGKLKAYLGASLPILLSNVPPNAHALTDEAGAEIVASDPVALGQALQRLLSDPLEWRTRHQRAASYAQRFDWQSLFDEQLPKLGITHHHRP